jgi:hypothetical protein
MSSGPRPGRQPSWTVMGSGGATSSRIREASLRALPHQHRAVAQPRQLGVAAHVERLESRDRVAAAELAERFGQRAPLVGRRVASVPPRDQRLAGVIAVELAKRDGGRLAHAWGSVGDPHQQRRSRLTIARAREQAECADQPRLRTVVGGGEPGIDRGTPGCAERGQRGRCARRSRIVAGDHQLDERGRIAGTRREPRARELGGEVEIGGAGHDGNVAKIMETCRMAMARCGSERGILGHDAHPRSSHGEPRASTRAPGRYLPGASPYRRFFLRAAFSALRLSRAFCLSLARVWPTAALLPGGV